MKMIIAALALSTLVLAGCDVPCFTSYSGSDIVACPGPGVTADDGPPPVTACPEPEEICGTPDLEDLDDLWWEESIGDVITCPPHPGGPVVLGPKIGEDWEDWGNSICGTPHLWDLEDIDWTKVPESSPLEDRFWIPTLWPAGDGARCGTPDLLDDESLAQLLESLRRETAAESPR
ncbi:MAG: hypothetical protein ACYTG4_12520 [Planctomycetota bacterium]|jgi:hypothetical protein